MTRYGALSIWSRACIRVRVRLFATSTVSQLAYTWILLPSVLYIPCRNLGYIITGRGERNRNRHNQSGLSSLSQERRTHFWNSHGRSVILVRGARRDAQISREQHSVFRARARVVGRRDLRQSTSSRRRNLGRPRTSLRRRHRLRSIGHIPRSAMRCETN